jgi:type I restriction enzyme, S subunit
MTDLPAGWRLLTPDQLGGHRQNLIIGPFGSSLKVSDYRDSGVPLVFTRHIRSGGFVSTSTRFISREKADLLRAHTVRAGDVLITKMGDPPGDSCVYEGTVPAVITADCIRLRPSEDFDSAYVAFAVQSPDVRRQMELITRGVAQRKVSLARFRDGIRLPVPPLAEQRRIVEILEDNLSRLDAAARGLNVSLKRLASYEASALSRCREGDERRLSDLTLIQGGIQKQPRRTPKQNAYPFLRVANVTRHGLHLDEVHLVELFEGELDRLRLQPGDLLVVEGNGSASQIGRAALWDGSIEDCVHQNHLIRVRPKTGLNAPYLEAVWNSPQNRRQLTDLASSSSGLHTLSVSKLKSLKLPVPTLERQQELVAELQDVRDRRRRLAIELDSAITRTKQVRRSLLAAAFSGRLTGRTSDMEMAEEMALV